MFKPVIIIPCYNHSESFAKIAKKIQNIGIPVIVVDDASRQDQSKALRKICAIHKFEYISNEKNGGKGRAFATGMFHAQKNGYNYAIQIDADGQHDLNDVEKFIDVAKQNPNAFVVGEPVYDESAPKSRLVGRKITNFWVGIETLNWKMPDAMCGFRGYPIGETIKCLKRMRFFRMGFDIEILVRLYRAGVKIIPIKTRVIYPENGVSHFNVWRDNFYISMLHMYLCATMPAWLIKRMFKNAKAN